MSVSKDGILFWCKSVEETFQPREDVPHNEKPKQIPEQFLAAALRYLRAVCVELPDKE
ncbi:MAG TPA: hypothetical protein VII94_02275 [Candidatus Saccharimonadales bacterium]